MDRSGDEPGRLPPRRPSPPRRSRSQFAAASLVVAAAVAVAIAAREHPFALPWNGSASSATPSPIAIAATIAASTTQPESPPTPTAIPVAAERARIDRLLAGESGVCGIVLMSEDGEIVYSRNADTPFIAASLYKLILIADVERRIDEGEFGLSRNVELLPEYFPGLTETQDGYYAQDAIGASVTVDEALYATGAYSSNVAARALLALTDTASLQAMAEAIGLTNTYFLVDPQDILVWPPTPGVDAPPGDVATAVAFVEEQAADGPVMLTTPRDMAIYFSRLLAGRIVSGEASFAIYGILAQQVVDDRFPVLLPTGTGMAHKTGNLDHVVHDVGVIFAPNGPVILAAMIEAPPDDAEATELIQQLALIAYETEIAPEQSPTPTDA